MSRFLIALLGAFSLSACAQQPAAADADTASAPVATSAPTQIETAPGSPEERALQALRSINPDIPVDSIGDAPLPGFRQLIVSGQVLYISDDGRYLLQGSLFDMVEKKDLAQAALAEIRRDLISKVPASERIVFAPANPKYTVSVFTDVECGYCRKLHQEIADYNKLGIAIEYLAFPRAGPGSEDARLMEAVWCSADRRGALTAAKEGKSVPRRQCINPVNAHHALGQRVGLTGTPMIIAADGTVMPGYMPPDALLAALESLAAEDK